MYFSTLRGRRVGCWLLCACAGLSACGGERPQEQVGQAEEALCPGNATLKGVDVSEYQGNINWGQVKASGIDFAIARTGDGTYQDGTFAQNWAGMKNAGIVRGAYHFFEPGGDPVAQANIVISKVGVLGPGDLPVTADVEVTGGQGPGTIAANLHTFLDHVQAGTGKVPMIYTAPGFWDGSVGSGSFGNDPLWVANWGVNCPSLPTGWNSFVVWQFSDMGSVGGIGSNVDRDEFNGDLAALNQFAGGSVDWGAQFVSQSWPYATMTMSLTVNQVLPASIKLKNVGTKNWDGMTRLGTTQPRDRASAFAGSDWVGPNRPAQASGTVPPGGEFEFKFSFHAPDKPGMYDEYFGVVQEGVHWFSDPGQGGPPDNDIEAKIQVVEADFHGEFVQQSFPTLQEAPLDLTVGQSVSGTILLKNVGNAPWKAGEAKLAPTPRDKPSALAGTDWLSPTRVSSPPADVPPGSSYAFPVTLTAMAPGDYTQTFGLVEDGVTWFADAPKGGGPPDDFIAVHVVVHGDTGNPPTGAGGGGGAAGGPSDANDTASSHCALSEGARRGQRGDAAWLALFGVALAVARARRRR